MFNRVILLVSCLFLVAINGFGQVQLDTFQKFSSEYLPFSFSAAYLKSGSRVVSGNVTDTVVLNANTSLINSSFKTSFIAFYDNSGQLVWYHTIKATSSSAAVYITSQVLVDKDENIYVAGQFTNSVQFYPGEQKNGGLASDVFFLKMDTTGKSFVLGVQSDILCTAFSVAPNGNVAVGGRTSASSNRAIIAVFDKNGVIQKNGLVSFKSGNNRDIISSLVFSDNNELYYAGRCNGNELSTTGIGVRIKGPNDINQYIPFLGKLSQDLRPIWLKGGVAQASSKPFDFVLNSAIYDNREQMVLFSGKYERNIFSLDGDTLDEASLQNSDARKPILLALDSSGTYKFKTTLNMPSVNQRGEIYTLTQIDNDYLVTADIENYVSTGLHYNGLSYNWGDRGFAVMLLNNKGKVKSAMGTVPSDQLESPRIYGASYTSQHGVMLALNQFQYNNYNLPNIIIPKGSQLIFGKICNGKIEIKGNGQFCKGDTALLKIDNSFQKSVWNVNGSDFNNGKTQIELYDSSVVWVKAIDNKGCFLLSDTLLVNFNNLPKVQLQGFKNEYCANSEGDDVVVFPVGGLLSGSGLVENRFEPSKANLGTNEISYAFKSSNGCTSEISKNVVVNPLPKVEITNKDTSFCANEGKVKLTAKPAGGSFTGMGVKNDEFNPNTGVGLREVYYSYTDNNGCENTDTLEFNVLEAKQVSFTGLDSAYCPDDTLIALDANIRGGVYSGNGVVDSFFNPSIATRGVHSVTYNITFKNGCKSESIQNVRVKSRSECETFIEKSMVNQFEVFPNPNTGTFFINTKGHKIQNLTIYNSCGKSIFSKSKFELMDDQLITVNLISGVYIIKMSNGNNYEIARIVVN